MSDQAGGLKRGTGHSRTGTEALGDPVDVLHEDNLREREIIALLETIATSETPDTDKAARVLTFLRNDLRRHLEDEEEDLFPLLRRRCKPDEEIEKAIECLASNRRQAEGETPKIEAILEALEYRGATGEERETLTCYAAHARRHLILENAIILPFARLRLTHDDLEYLRLCMAQRRELYQSLESKDVE